MANFIILDIQGFQIENKIMPKELAAFDGKKVSHCLFKPPFQYSFLDKEERKNVIWLERNYHGIMWNFGYIDLDKFSNIVNDLCKNYDTIYVKGNEKASFLKLYLKNKNIIEVPQDEQPSLSRFVGKPKCFYHNLSFAHCALSNVYLLYNFLEV